MKSLLRSSFSNRWPAFACHGNDVSHLRRPSANESIVDSSVVFAETGWHRCCGGRALLPSKRRPMCGRFTSPIQSTHLVIEPDGDSNHVAGASGGAYLEILPDTRRTHGDKLIRGENFSPAPGKMAVLHYNVHFSNPGRYYVWVRAFSTGSEDNGLHVGINGQWPEPAVSACSGVMARHSWRWDSKQRTEEQHCGERYKIFIDVAQPGTHTISFSMRDDGFAV